MKHAILVTYGEPQSSSFIEQLVYSWRILLGLTRTVLTARITRTTARKLRRTLRRKRVIAALTILARDAAGNQRRLTRRIVVRRR